MHAHAFRIIALHTFSMTHTPRTSTIPLKFLAGRRLSWHSWTACLAPFSLYYPKCSNPQLSHLNFNMPIVFLALSFVELHVGHFFTCASTRLSKNHAPVVLFFCCLSSFFGVSFSRFSFCDYVCCKNVLHCESCFCYFAPIRIFLFGPNF